MVADFRKGCRGGRSVVLGDTGVGDHDIKIRDGMRAAKCGDCVCGRGGVGTVNGNNDYLAACAGWEGGERGGRWVGDIPDASYNGSVWPLDKCFKQSPTQT